MKNVWPSKYVSDVTFRLNCPICKQNDLTSFTVLQIYKSDQTAMYATLK